MCMRERERERERKYEKNTGGRETVVQKGIEREIQRSKKGKDVYQREREREREPMYD